MKLSDTITTTPAKSIPTDGSLANWPEPYYEEKDAANRLTMLEQAMSAGLSPEEDSYRRKLFDIRYKKSADGSYADLFMRSFMEFSVLGKNKPGRFGMSSAKKSVLKSLKKMGIGDEVENRELYDSILVSEFCHLGQVYIALSADSRQYTSVIFGFGKLKDKTLITKLHNDLDYAGLIVADTFDLHSEMDLWLRGLDEARRRMLPTE